MNEFDLTGEAVWFAAIAACIRFCKHIPKAAKVIRPAAQLVKTWNKATKNMRIGIKLHDAHHSWTNPINGKKKWYKHVEIRIYHKGIKSSAKRIQIPYGKGCKLKNCK